jgi:hypothetical protein
MCLETHAAALAAPDFFLTRGGALHTHSPWSSSASSARRCGRWTARPACSSIEVDPDMPGTTGDEKKDYAKTALIFHVPGHVLRACAQCRTRRAGARS